MLFPCGMRTTTTTVDGAEIICDICLWSGEGFPDVLVGDHDLKVTKDVFQAFGKGVGVCLIVGSAFHKNPSAKMESVTGVISDTLLAFANGRNDDQGLQPPLAVFAINNATSALDDGLTPLKILY